MSSSSLTFIRQRWEDNMCHVKNMTSRDSCEAEHRHVELETHHSYYNSTIIINKEMVHDLWVESPDFEVL